MENPSEVIRDLLERWEAEGDDGTIDLRGANLHKANLYMANLSEADLYGVNLQGAYLTGSHLDGADLRGADMTKAILPLPLLGKLPPMIGDWVDKLQVKSDDQEKVKNV